MKPSVATLVRGEIHLSTDYIYKDFAKSLGGRWNPETKQWLLPNTAEVCHALLSIPRIALAPELQPPPVEATVPQVETVDGSCLPVSLPLFAHQVAAASIGLQHDATALLMEQGTGKTLAAIAVAGRRFLAGQIRRLLVVAPLSVLPVWQQEMEQYADFPFAVTVLGGSCKKKEEQLAEIAAAPAINALEVVIVNYESTWRIQGALEFFVRDLPAMIVADESQRIKAHDSKQSRAMHRLGDLAQYKQILSGTPVTNSPLDFWSQYRFLAPDIFPRSWYAFRNSYAILGGYTGREIILYKNLDELTRKAHSVAYRVTKAEALDLPEYTDQTLYCDLEPAAARIYNDLAKDKIAELSADKTVTTAEVIVQLLRLSQLTGGYIRPDNAEEVQIISRAKIKLLEATLDDILASGQKVVIFARFRAEIAAIISLAERMVGSDGVRAIWGDIKPGDRGAAVRDFQTNPAVRVFVAQIQTAGLGITLTAASTAIFYSLDYSFANYDQARARIHRLGQHSPCTYLHLVARRTVDERVLAALAQKRSMADDLVDNWRTAFAPIQKEE